jgi:Fe-S-cluster containining protein
MPEVPMGTGLDRVEANGTAGSDWGAVCLECGLCCRGVLYGKVFLQEEELEWAAELRLPILQEDARSAFRQPCACFVNQKCSIYEQRFAACRAYR